MVFFRNKQLVWKAFAASLWVLNPGVHRQDTRIPPTGMLCQPKFAAKITMVSRPTCHFKISFWEGWEWGVVPSWNCCWGGYRIITRNRIHSLKQTNSSPPKNRQTSQNKKNKSSNHALPSGVNDKLAPRCSPGLRAIRISSPTPKPKLPRPLLTTVSKFVGKCRCCRFF